MITRTQRAMIALIICARIPKYFSAIMQILRMGEFWNSERPFVPRQERAEAIDYVSNQALVPLLRDIKAMLDIPMVAEFLKYPEESPVAMMERQKLAEYAFQRLEKIEEPNTKENKDGK